MKKPRARARWARHDREFRDPDAVAAQWPGGADPDPALVRHRVRGGFWAALAATGRALLVTREYEHLVMALAVREGRPSVTWLRLPHPSGVAVDATRRRVLVACTRNPNMVLELAAASDGTLLPRRCWYYPGRLYLHDLAFVGGALHGNAVGLDVVVRLPESGGFEPAWWPRCVDAGAEPRLGPNTLQLNSIAAGPDLAGSFFSASAAAPGRWRPGHARFPVDGRGVVFAGDTREPIAGGLTRPHSARLHRGRIYVDNSGYGELGRLRDGSYEPVARLPGWTRGLCLHDRVAFVGTSRVIPRFRQYAPGLRVSDSVAGVHAVEVATGRILGSILWPEGNQVFAVEMAPAGVGGLPARRRGQDLQPLFFHGAAR